MDPANPFRKTVLALATLLLLVLTPELSAQNDVSMALASYGALHVSLSWPGRYSHSPVEVLDLGDLQALEKLIYAIATAP